MNKTVRTLFACVLFTSVGWSQSAIAQAPVIVEKTEEVSELGHRLTMVSSILDEEREILVRLPSGYIDDEAGRYPVIYVLDGNSHFSHGSLGAGLLEGNGRMPESIIVALPNRHGMRGRDLAREKEKFRRFINEEVFPVIDTTYRSSDHRILFGHSLAGYFALSILADHSEMFDGYIVASPAVQVRNSELIGKFEALFASRQALAKSLYITMTDASQEGAIAGVLNRLVALLETNAPDTLKWRYDFVGGQVHMTTPFPTLYAGLSHSFRDFQAPSFETVGSFEEWGGVRALELYFAGRADKYGGHAGVPEQSLRQFGYLYSEAGLHSQAIALFERSVRDYPDAPFAFSALGDGYTAADRSVDALEAYQQALALAEAQGSPNVRFFQRQVTRIEEKLGM